MPTVNLPKYNKTSSDDQSGGNAAPPVKPDPIAPNPSPFDWKNNDFGDDDPWGLGGDDLDSDLSPMPPSKAGAKPLTPQERVVMIEEVFLSVLGRAADTRDINYYKYSTMSREEMIDQLLKGKEHLKLIQDGKEFPSISTRADQADTRIRMLEAQVKDQLDEFQELTNLLKQKNIQIEQMRAKSNPFRLEARRQTVSETMSEREETSQGVDQVGNEDAVRRETPTHTHYFTDPAHSAKRPESKDSFMESLLKKLQQIIST